jgi:hypothetical protein
MGHIPKEVCYLGLQGFIVAVYYKDSAPRHLPISLSDPSPRYRHAEWRISSTNHTPSGVSEPESARVSIASRV